MRAGDSHSAKTVTMQFKGGGIHHATVWRLDADHGDVHRLYARLGEPRYPTSAQIQQLRQASQLAPPEDLEIQNQALTLSLAGNSLVLIELQ